MQAYLWQQKKHVVRGIKIWHIGENATQKQQTCANQKMTHPAPPHKTPAHYIGVILCNLGTPTAPTPAALRRYLAEFLTDPRVVEIPKLVWWVILYCFILPFRPKKSAKLYQKIWDATTNDSPLRTITYQQQEALQNTLNKQSTRFKVAVGMRYGTPSLASAVTTLKQQGCTKVLLVPLYPQYASATVGSAYDAFFRTLMAQRWAPTPRIVAPFFDHAAYIKALAENTETYLQGLTFTPEVLVLSYHGIPQKTHEKGDPYPCQCRKTSRLLLKALNWPEEKAITTFQSRFGPAEWVQPYTDDTLKDLAKKGVKKVAVITPAFYTDCLETLEEIAQEGAAVFKKAGGQDYAALPCLNASGASVTFLKTLVAENTTNW